MLCLCYICFDSDLNQFPTVTSPNARSIYQDYALRHIFSEISFAENILTIVLKNAPGQICRPGSYDSCKQMSLVITAPGT